jgi:glycosyltransferase involved in cell wall biosynthesis/predicted SAM-dependent methyltransferase
MKAKKKKISLCLIVKNEEPVLERCIRSMEGCYDELIIVDTGSTDKTVEIAKKLGARVEHFKWIDDFGTARNYSFSFATGDWIMWVDADDILEKGHAQKFREIVHQHDNDPNVTGINFPYIYSHESGGTGEIPNFKYHRLRIIKKGSGEWVGRIHEYIRHDSTKAIRSDEVIFHHYRDEGKGTQNTARNLRILKKVVDDCTPEQLPRYLFYYGKECIYNGLYDQAIEAFEKYIPLSNWIPEKHRAMYEMAVCYLAKGDIQNARKYCFEAMLVDENYCDPYILMGKMAYEEKNWRDTIKWMQASTWLNSPKTLFFDFIPFQTYVPQDYMAMAYWHLGDLESGKIAVDECLRYKPHDSRFLFNWKWFHKVDGKIGIVIPTLQRKEQLINCLNNIFKNAIIDEFQTFVGVDGNPEYYSELKGLEIFENEKIQLSLYQKSGAPILVEKLVDEAQKAGCAYIAYLGDDSEPKPGFLIHAWKDSKGGKLVAFNDRVTKDQCQHWFAPIHLRKELGGYFFYKGYSHVGCDNELMIKADRLGKFIRSENARVDHLHYISAICSDQNRVAQKDDCYERVWGNAELLEKDRALLKRRIENNFIGDSDELLINVGAGYKNPPGYLSLDPFEKADIQRSIFDPDLFLPGTISGFLAEHVIEHFSFREANDFISICHRALKPGGKLEISCPDMGKIDQVPDMAYRLKVMYGWQTNPGQFHKSGYTKSSLSTLLLSNGFQIESFGEKENYGAPEIRIVAIKNR